MRAGREAGAAKAEPWGWLGPGRECAEAGCSLEPEAAPACQGGVAVCCWGGLSGHLRTWGFQQERLLFLQVEVGGLS